MSEYSGSLEHVVAELERLDLLLRVQVWRARQRSDQDEQGLPAYVVSDTEVDTLLETPIGAPPWAEIPFPPDALEAVQSRLDEMAAEVAGRTQESLREGVELRLVVLAYLFDLAPFDLDVVLVCLAPELDRRYERLYAYLHDDVTRRHPTVDLVLNLLCPDLETRVAARSRFSARAPLRRHHVVEVYDEPGRRSPSLLGKAVDLDPRVARYLLGDDEPDERLEPFARLIAPTTGLDELVFPAPFTKQVARLADHARTDGDDLVVYLQGRYGVGKRAVAEAFGQALGADLVVADGRRLAEARPDELGTLARLVDREARLQGALLYWDGFDALLGDDRADQEARLAAVLPVVEARPGPTFLGGEAPWEPKGALRGTAFVRLELPQPGYDERLALWRAALAAVDGVTGAADIGAGGSSDDVDVAALASKFRLSGGQIGDAAAGAGHLARARDPATPRVTRDDLHAACRLQSNRRLAELAQKIIPRYRWDDIVLPADQMALLREIYDQVQYRAVVYDAWGFERKLALGKGLDVLFAGPPGTGKTMAADVLAHELGLDLYKIDLSRVLSKYIGETEKNLARIFDEATTSNAILFFDEADALFGKRTQVRDAHDRYANVEISFLLQRMEEYEGVVILATNLRKNMDEAFVRRLHFTVDFPMPGVEDRRRIWAQVWPEPMPRDPALDLELLAREVQVAGGSIRNIAVAGAFLAAADGGVVTMQHLRHATEREYQKMGKVLTSGDLGGS